MPLKRSPFHPLHKLVRDLLVLVGSILIAVVLVRVGAIELFLKATGGSTALSSFLAGAFFTSIFTVAPAAVGLIALGTETSPIFVAFFGAIGAVLVDSLIASFVRKDLSEDLNNLTNKFTLKKHLLNSFHFGFLKWVALVTGILLVATPLPDEPGLFLIGLSRVKTWILPLVFFIAHFIGIFTLVSIALAI